ncbi:hypothetical protein DYB30_003233 [Aphanomyces astaci]|uniref:TOG domain-containing protein n=1 Tax=Aphanomyces astaci TaxID=112090 RepID=A0A397D496_APHAT|nr:hypothetical protein DYB38_000696 [Aphanomyces astaci]RHY72676.1 hypothetical protein DYB30_003233 [Aphanomyces astaci]
MAETEVGKWLQRDVNCLSDPQRMVRKKSLEKLSQVSDLVAKFGQDHLLQFFHAQLMKPLLVCVADPVEKCRELSLRGSIEFAKLGAFNSEERVRALILAIYGRVGKAPFVETAEEIRLLLLELLHAVLQRTPTEQSLPAEVMDVLGKTASDPFPDAKKACCDATLVLAHKWKPLVKLHLGTVVKPLTMNLGHQHAKIRQCTLQALEAVVPCGSSSLPELMKDILLPNLSKVLFDRSPSVRKQLVQTTGSWLEHIDELRQFEAALLPLFLSGIADESPDVQSFCLTFLDKLSVKWQQTEEDEEGAAPRPSESSADMDITDDDASAYVESPPFLRRPGRGAIRLVQRLLGTVLPSLLDQCSDWTALTRQKAASILRVVLILAEDAVNAHVDKILTALAKSCRDEEASVVEAVAGSMQIVGRHGHADLLFSLLLPLAAGRLAGQDTPHHRTNGLVLLSMAIAGMEAPRILPHMETITATLSEAGLRDTDVPEMQQYLAKLTSTIVTTGSPLFASHDVLAFRLFWVLNHLVAATPQDSVAFYTAYEAMQNLATAACNVDIEVGLYRKHLSQLIAAIRPKPDAPVWSKTSSSRVLFDSLCRRGGRATADQMHVVVPIVLAHLAPSNEPDVRLSFLALLETLLGNDLMAQVGIPLIHMLYHEILKRLDDSNDLVRKAACATYITFLRAAPRSHFRGTIIEYSMDALFVHLDDSDPDVQVERTCSLYCGFHDPIHVFQTS